MTAVTDTLAWVAEFVLPHRLCPFAYRPWQEGKVAVESCPQEALEEMFFWALTQVQGFIEGQGEAATTLLVFPQGLADFPTFLDFVHTFEETLTDTGADALVQLAHFHPDYVFADTPTTDPANLTNRSPWPVLQLLRVADVSEAVAHYPEVATIPERNIARMRQLFS